MPVTVAGSGFVAANQENNGQRFADKVFDYIGFRCERKPCHNIVNMDAEIFCFDFSCVVFFENYFIYL